MVTFKNYGLTPAYNVLEKLSIWYVHGSADHRFDPSPLESGVTINPSGTTASCMHTTRSLTGDEVASIESTKNQHGSGLLVVGELTYETFGVRRTVRFGGVFFDDGAKDHRLVPGQNWSD
jgi:hypothetical protein